MNMILWAIPVFGITMLIELLTSRHAAVKGYRAKDSAASLSMGVGNLVVMFSMKGLLFGLFMLVYQLRIFDLPPGAWWVWLLLIPTEDFFYYWYHRASHEVRFFWAAHVNHHSSTHYNLSTALRQSWTGPLIGWVFWMPLPLLGFHPLMVVTAQSISLLYQYWIHTELIGRMGPFEWVFNTPSHHRVHHGRDALYLDRNHGGILILWDRLFGSFEPERARPVYGLTTDLQSHNPLAIAFHGWGELARDLRQARSWRERLCYLFGPPGWRAEGSGQTAGALRRAALEAEQARPGGQGQHGEGMLAG
ncbi:MAG: sterol desaturase family protein [Planctomycetota bacterium]|nr:sterol desaturase family protein [Planctomycetota bacterium]